MAKWHGMIGYAQTEETAPGIWVEHIIEKPYYGDVDRNRRRLESGSTVNSNINVANEISIVADPFANENFFSMRYVTFMGAKWKITDVKVEYPRLILGMGEIYHENEN